MKRKPRIAKKIEELIIPVKERMHEVIWRIAFLCADRMFFEVTDFYRSCKRIVKIHGKEQKIDSIEAIPLDEISEKNRMCIDEVTIKTICGNDEFWYKLPNRDKAYDLFMKCYKILIPETNGGEMDWKATAEIIRGDAVKPVIIPPQETAKPRKTQ